ncbi:MAG: glutamate--tRNA ligase [Halobacteriovoraceae bacterium]|nr:glutamate--tRNA ligase [Halobacteriovoraceae bacterium]
MTVRTRFAPGPTGHLHIGGARTALYNYLYARKNKGEFILRVEDTDKERCKKEFEISQINDLKWLGIDYDEGPDKGGNIPYRQSERLSIYQDYAQKLIEKNLAYYAFDTEEELEMMKEQAMRQKRSPHYEGRYKNMSYEEAMDILASGKKGVIRFRTPRKSYSFNDKVRGRVVFKEGMVGDFILMRSNGMPVYNFCCMIDDWQMDITHVLRAEEHLSNTLRQLMLYEAFEASPPQFAHLSLLVGEDRQKLSKRHGATSITSYKEQSYLPQALVNYLSLLGHSHPDGKDFFDKEELIRVFQLERLSKAPALFDYKKCKFFNGHYLRKIPVETLIKKVDEIIPKQNEYHRQNDEWKEKFVNLFKEQIELLPEITEYLDKIFGLEKSDSPEYVKFNDLESTKNIRKYLKAQVQQLIEKKITFVDKETFDEWSAYCKKTLNIKGKSLFMGMRVSLTGKEKGPELQYLIPITPIQILLSRLND